MQRCDPLVVGGLLTHDGVRSGALSIVDRVDRVHEPEVRVESVTSGLRSLSLSVGLSLSGSGPSVVRASLGCGSSGRTLHPGLHLGKRAVHAFHRGCHLPGRQLAEPICCGELLDLCGVLREQRDKVFERKPGRFGRVTDPDERLCRVSHRHLRNGAVQFLELRLNPV